MDQPKKIFIYGVPASGKTTFSIDLQSKLGYKLIEADYLREAFAQKEKTEQEDPFVYIGTKEAYRKFGDLTEENVIKGLKAVRKSMSPYVTQEIKNHTNDFIFEGSFLDPQELSDMGEMILIVTTDEQKHLKQYFQHREHDENNTETFKAVRIIQEYFLNEAKKYPVKVIENDFDFKTI